MKIDNRRIALVCGLLIGCVIMLCPGFAYAGASLSLTGGNLWEIGPVKAQEDATSTANQWTVTNNNSGGTEHIDIKVEENTGHWSAWITQSNNNNTTNKFVLRENNSSTSSLLIKSTNVRLKDNLADTESHQFGLWFKAPPTDSDEGAHTLTVTLTATGWVWQLNETTCNALAGWAWYTTNGRSACWSKCLASSVSWNKGVGSDSDNPGAYTCASGYTLQQRMEAAVAGEWYKIVSNVAGTNITSSHNGSSGYSVISALAIADCIDGTRDLCSTDGCLGSSWSTINSALRTWAGAAGKSALPYLATDAGTSQTDNDYWDACSQNSSNDVPLGCTDGLFCHNKKVCGDSDRNRCWAAACGRSDGGMWGNSARVLGHISCSAQDFMSTSKMYYYESFRAVVRP